MDDLFKMDLIMTYQSWLKNIFYIKNKLKLHILWPQKKIVFVFGKSLSFYCHKNN